MAGWAPHRLGQPAPSAACSCGTATSRRRSRGFVLIAPVVRDLLGRIQEEIRARSRSARDAVAEFVCVRTGCSPFELMFAHTARARTAQRVSRR